MVTSPTAVYRLVANRLAANDELPGGSTDYAAARQAAEVQAAKTAVGGAPSLDDVFAVIGEPFASAEGFVAVARAREIEVEHELLQPAPGAAERLAEARGAGKQVAFLSDMHLPAIEIEHVLRRFGFFHEDDILLVSSEVGAAKSRDGELFRKLIEQYDVDPATTIHVGDNAWSDVTMAEKHGFRAEHLTTATANRYEDILEKYSDATGGFSSLLAGAGRQTRMSPLDTSILPPKDATEQIRTVATGVAAPVMLAFVLWTLQRCREEGITRAYFLTRDGELPFEIASRLPATLTDGIELRMLGVGRSAIALPAACVVDYDKWLTAGFSHASFLSQHADEVEAESLLRRAGLAAEAHREMVERHVEVPHGPFSEAGYAQWMAALASDELRAAVLAESRARRTPVLEYFTQEGLASGERSAMIDVGWTGQQAAMLTALVEEAGGVGPLHLHIGARGNRELLHHADIERWLFDDRTSHSPIANPVALFEAFAVTLKESVIGYERQGDTMVTVHRDNQHDEALLAWGQTVLRESILSTVEGVLFDESLARSDADLCDASAELLRAFWETPTVAEAKAWGAFPFEQDQLGKVVRTLAIRYDLDQLKSRRDGEFFGLDWKAGSVAISAPPIRAVLQAAEVLRSRIPNR